MGLTYRMVSEITIFGSPVSGSVTNNAWDQSWANFGAYPNNTVEHIPAITTRCTAAVAQPP